MNIRIGDETTEALCFYDDDNVRITDDTEMLEKSKMLLQKVNQFLDNWLRSQQKTIA